MGEVGGARRQHGEEASPVQPSAWAHCVGVGTIRAEEPPFVAGPAIQQCLDLPSLRHSQDTPGKPNCWQTRT